MPSNPLTATTFRKWLPLIVLSLALAIVVLDTTILNVSLRTIINDLHTDIQSIQWIITAYSLMLAAFTLTGGRLGDLFGRKKMFMTGAIIFAIGSFIMSVAHTVAWAIIGEAIIEGIGAALMMPATASLLVSNYRGRDRQIGFGVWGGIAAGAAALGPVFGGWLTTYYSWRWAFRINVIVALVLILGSILIKESRDQEEKPTLDYIGIVLSALGLLSIVFGLIKASTYGWFTAKEQFVLFRHALNLGSLSVVPLFILLGFGILTLFAFWERRMADLDKTPLVSLKLFTNTQFIIGASITAILALGQAGMGFVIPVFLQSVKNLDALHTGFAMLPLSLSLLVAALFSAYISKYISPKRIIQIGLVIDTFGFLVLRASINASSSQWALAPGFILFGVGMGLMMSQASNLTLSAVSVEESGEASGVNSTLRQVGATFGAAVLGAILISSLTTNLVSGVNASSIIPDQLKPVYSQAVSQQTSGIEFGGSTSFSGSGIPIAIKDEITSISHTATVDASKKTLAYGIIFIILALLISIKLPDSSDIEIEQSVAEHGHQPSTIPLKKARARATILGLILALVAGTGGYYLGKKQPDGNQNVSPPVQPQIQPQVLGQNNIQPDQLVLQPTIAMQNYTNTRLRFSLKIPADWQIKNLSQDDIALITPQKIWYSIQSYSTNNSDLNSLRTFLNSQSNVQQITQADYNDIQGLSFRVNGLYGKGYAFLENGRLYYILGPDIDSAIMPNIEINSKKL